MTFARKFSFAAIFAATLAVAGYEAHVISTQQTELRGVQRASLQLATELTALRASDDDSRRSVSFTQTPATEANPLDSPSAADATENPRLSRVRQLREFLSATPGQTIPELKLLSNLDWLSIDGEGNPDDPRAVFYPGELRSKASLLRLRAKEKFARMMWKALDRYKSEHSGAVPGDLAELPPFFESPPDPAILSRYEVLRSGPVSTMQPTERIIMEKYLADEERDQRLYFTASAAWKWDSSPSELNGIIADATWAFAKDNHRKPVDPTELYPYVEKDTQKHYDLATLQKFWPSPHRRDPLSQVGERDTIRVIETEGAPKVQIVNRR